MASALQGRQAQVEAVRLLMRRGADPSAKNLENEQPAQLVPEGPLGEQVREPGSDSYQCSITLYHSNGGTMKPVSFKAVQEQPAVK